MKILNKGILASRHRFIPQTEYFLNFNDVNEDHLVSNVSTAKTSDLTLEFEGRFNSVDDFFYVNNRPVSNSLDGINIFIGGNGNVTCNYYGRGTYQLGSITQNSNFRKFRFELSPSGLAQIDFYINDVLFSSTPANSSFKVSASPFVFNKVQRPSIGYGKGKIKSINIDGESFSLNEGSGFICNGNLGSTLTGGTIEPTGVTYWNNNVWTEI